MSPKLWKAAKVAIVAGAVVFVVSLAVGRAETATTTANAVAGTAWGVGVLGGAAREAGPSFKQGVSDASALAAGGPRGYVDSKRQAARDVAAQVEAARRKESERKAALAALEQKKEAARKAAATPQPTPTPSTTQSHERFEPTR